MSLELADLTPRKETPEVQVSNPLVQVARPTETSEDQGDTRSDSFRFIQNVREFKISEIKKHLAEGRIFINGHEITKIKNCHVIKELYKHGQKKSLQDIRKEFNSYFNYMAGRPLSCEGECASSKKTCLPAVQELFLWSLQAINKDSMELAVLLWTHCDDKISCACIGWAVKKEMTKKKTNKPDQKIKLEQEAKVFQQLAISTLKGCHDENGDLTRSLLRKQCPWWNDLSILQIVVGTKNMEFLAQSACEEHMTELWFGCNPKESSEELGAGWPQSPVSVSESDRDSRLTPPDMAARELNNPQSIFLIRDCQTSRQLFQTLVDAPKDAFWLDFLQTCGPFSYLPWPVVKYTINLVLHVVFLGIYCYVLLFSFSRSLTKTFCVLIVWVTDIASRELRQALTPNPWSNAKCLEVNKHCMSYWKQNWNWLTVLTIGLFAIGMLVFAEDEYLHNFGRTVLSIDLFFFSIRALQLLMVFKELGLMLVMVRKMIQDTINFMFILLVFVFAFAVSSESILYSKRELGYRHIFLILRKAYWQVFGELFLGEISVSGDNDTSSIVCTDPPCPSTYGQYFVPIMLGFYVMVTNVLLLNLLIARFNMTFTKVHDQAVEYQSWHRTMIIIEYHDQPHLPPPLNILRLTYSCLAMSFVMCCGKSVHIFQQCRKENETENNNENDNDNKNENENDNEKGNKIENKFEYKELKDLEERHALLACQEVKPRVFGMLGDNEDKENNFADTDKTLTMMQEQVIKLCQDINLLRRNIKQETCHCRSEREMLY